MGSCLLEKTALNDDEDSESCCISNHYDGDSAAKASLFFPVQTITAPSESLLNELQTVEGKGGKAESFSKQQLQMAHDEEATLFVFRLKSLKQGQSRSLLTQAARHHAAQGRFFRQALKSLEDIEPLVKTVTEQQHIDYHFSGLEYVDEEDDDDFSDTLDGGDSSVDYKQNDQDQYVSKPRNSTEENLATSYWKPFSLRGETREVSYTEPIIAKNEHDSVDGIKQTWRTYRRKFNTYALPLPNTADSKGLNSGGPVVLHQTLKSSLERGNHNVILAENILNTLLGIPSRFSGRATKGSQTAGPSTVQAWLMEPTSAELLLNPTAVLLPSSPKVSPKVSPTTSPTLVSSPKTSQLHELPRTPTITITESSRPVGRIGHSNQSTRSYNPPTLKLSELDRTYTLLPPMHFISRSFSVPYNGSRAMAMSIVEPQEATQKSEVFEYAVLSPVTPVSTPKMRSP